MAYTPNNIQIYCAAYSGALGGMGAAGRVLSISDSTKYSGASMVAGAFAQQFDTIWGLAHATILDVEMVTALAAVWFDRSVLVSAQTTKPTFYTNICNAIIAAITSGDAYVTSQGITPPDPGGGGSLPTAPVVDGRYILLVSGGVASWALQSFTPTISIAGGGSGPFVLGATWTPTGFNFIPAANSGGVIAPTTLRDNQGHGPTSVLGVANPVPPLVASYTLSVAGAVTVTGHVSEGLDSLDTNTIAVSWASRTFSGVGVAGATSATASGTNAALVPGGEILTGSATAVVNPIGQSFVVNPTNQKIYDLCVHTASPHTYTDQNGQPVIMGPGGNGVPTTFNFTNENAVVVSYDLYESSNLVTGSFTITRH
jgi:hypothetical protein